LNRRLNRSIKQRARAQRRIWGMMENKLSDRVDRWEDLIFPVYVIHSENVETIDGILWLDNQVLDDKNMLGETLGIRRIQTPMKNLYPLRYQIQDIVGMSQHRAKFFVDSRGRVIAYEKTETCKIHYHKITKRVRKEVATLIKLKNIDRAFAVKTPPSEDAAWAGVIYRNGHPWEIRDFRVMEGKSTWCKI